MLPPKVEINQGVEKVQLVKSADEVDEFGKFETLTLDFGKLSKLDDYMILILKKKMVKKNQPKHHYHVSETSNTPTFTKIGNDAKLLETNKS